MKELLYKQAYDALQTGIAVYGMKHGRNDSVFCVHDSEEIGLDAWMECDYFLVDDQVLDAGNKVDMVDIASHARSYSVKVTATDVADWAEELARLILVEVDRRIKAVK